MRLISSGIDRSKLRRPASTWATGMSSLTADERRRQRRVDVTVDDHDVRRLVLEHRLQGAPSVGRLVRVAARADTEAEVWAAGSASS